MSVTAPPRPPRPSDPLEREEIEALVEALIEEARQRARRRRRRYLEAALLSLLVGLALFAGFGGGRSDSAPSVAPSAFAAPRVPSLGGASSLSFRLVSVETSFRFVDRAPKGMLNKGDAMYVKDELRNGWADQFGRPRNAVVGSDSWVRLGLAKPGWELVRVKVTLPGGTLRLRALGQLSGTIVFRVVGGTGDFANARGTMKWQQRGNVPNLNDYSLRLP
jgi:hypothetical protein